jgi:hypothetical protein
MIGVMKFFEPGFKQQTEFVYIDLMYRGIGDGALDVDHDCSADRSAAFSPLRRASAYARSSDILQPRSGINCYRKGLCLYIRVAPVQVTFTEVTTRASALLSPELVRRQRINISSSEFAKIP